eukprot:TRINITY_DN25768_c0_g2_i2.p1 TRINITY_DN25768_c0_g2~~TRINITY_DN25768_c0_g2_i2.p1  ORF type:complete len:312 (+),score=46.01 TRINITY_DN25768_c0_g2_i2:272-1207(+)
MKLRVHFPNAKSLRFSFRRGGFETFADRLDDMLVRKPWVAVLAAAEDKERPRKTDGSEQKQFAPQRVGIAGIMQRVGEEERRTTSTLAEAFEDMSSLMENASKLVDIAHKLQQRQLAGVEEEDDVNAMLMSIGLVSPVTRDTVGRGGDYHQELSRQLCDFLIPQLTGTGGRGALALTDIYCLYNRARGTDLISPDDLLKACKLFEPLRLPLRLKRFPSGVCVVQPADRGTAQLQSITDALRTRAFITAPQLATQLSIPLVLASEYLGEAEREGVLCRDETAAGITYYPNFFSRPEETERILALLKRSVAGA